MCQSAVAGWLQGTGAADRWHHRQPVGIVLCLGAGPARKVGSLADTPWSPALFAPPQPKVHFVRTILHRIGTARQISCGATVHSSPQSTSRACSCLRAITQGWLAPARSQCSRYLRVLVCCCAGVPFSHSHSRPSYRLHRRRCSALLCPALHCTALRCALLIAWYFLLLCMH